MYWNIGKQYTLQKIVKYMKTTRLFIVHWYCIIDKTVQRYCNIGELCTLQSCKKNIENLDLAWRGFFSNKKTDRKINSSIYLSITVRFSISIISIISIIGIISIISIVVLILSFQKEPWSQLISQGRPFITTASRQS